MSKGTPALVTIVLVAVLAVVGMYFLHLGSCKPPPPPARDVGECVANGLLQKKSMSNESALDIGAKVKDATDATIGIKDKQTADVLQQVMSNDVQAQIVAGCVDQFANRGAQPIFNPLVKVSEKVSAFPLERAIVNNGSDYEQCVTDTQGRCRLLVAARRAGALYQIDAALAGYQTAHAKPDVAALRAGNVVEIALDKDIPPITFDVTRGGRGVAGVKVIPNTTGTFRNDDCYRSGSSDPNTCQSVLTPDGKATFHFWPRPAQVALVLVFSDGTPEIHRSVAVPADQTNVEVPIDPPPKVQGPAPAACAATAKQKIGSVLAKNGPIAGAAPSDNLVITVVDGVATDVSGGDSKIADAALSSLRGQKLSQGSCTVNYLWKL